MQLIMSTDIDIGIKSMSSVDQESHLGTDYISELTNENKENIERKERVTNECVEKEKEIKINIPETIENVSLAKDTNKETSDGTLENDPCNVIEIDETNSKVDKEKTIESSSDIPAAKNDQNYETDDKQEGNLPNNVDDIETTVDEDNTNLSLPIVQEMEVCNKTITCQNVKADMRKDGNHNVSDEIMKEPCLPGYENDDNDFEPKVKTNDLISSKEADNKESIDFVKSDISNDDLAKDIQKNVEETSRNEIECNNEDIIMKDKASEQLTLINPQIKKTTEAQSENVSSDSVLGDNFIQEEEMEVNTKDNIQNTEIEVLNEESRQSCYENSENGYDIAVNVDNKEPAQDGKVIEVKEIKASNDNGCNVTENQANHIFDVNQDKQITEENIETVVDEVPPQEETPQILDVDNNNTFNDDTTITNEVVSTLNLPDNTIKELNSTEFKEQIVSQDSNLKVIDKVGCHEDNCTKQLVSNPKVIERKKLTHISRLSNTLDILSDEEDETPKVESPIDKTVPTPSDKQCIDIEDDDIMVIDDETTSKNTEKVNDDELVTKNIESKEVNEDSEKKELMNEKAVGPNENAECSTEETDAISGTAKSESTEDNAQVQKPLLPPTFLKTCKKNLADMTREELEEFCIIKIVESVVDRSNLGELKSQIRTMTSNIEEYKKKATMLLKQNRDLQVVLKSVQEEQKKNPGAPVTPLKITRSVGMQVFMTEKGSRKRPALPAVISPLNNSNANFGNNRQPKSQNSQTRKSTPLQIPVPRLVPANNTNNAKNITSPTQSNTNNAAKPQRTNSLPNGIKIASPTAKPEKRTFEKMQQNNSVTVDLTDDEPPTKVSTRNANTPVRCVPPQNLMAPKLPLSQPLNSPRKVYIPIGGPSKQTIMLKNIPSQSLATPRPRAFAPKMIQNPNVIRTNLPRAAFKHPAPLPDSMKQYQPSNWKLLPPAPDLKLSKVENGIVISWKIDGYVEEKHEEIASYQLFAYQETSSPPSTSLWKKIGDVKALPLPMACTLTQFMAGYKYYFAVRAVDIKSRFGPFSLPGSILLLNKV